MRVRELAAVRAEESDHARQESRQHREQLEAEFKQLTLDLERRNKEKEEDLRRKEYVSKKFPIIK